jgi:O-succinylbenzoate synthase
VQYVEEPTSDLRASLDFSAATGIPIALDESLDEALAQASSLSACPAAAAPVAQALRALPIARSGAAGAAVAAVVVKPGVVGGYERAFQVAAWARARQPQVSSGSPSNAFTHATHTEEVVRVFIGQGAEKRLLRSQQ